jgi:predicted Fe-S protein YdhL (DUF1289 family)
LPQSLHNRRNNQPALPWKRLASTFASSTPRQGCASAVAAIDEIARWATMSDNERRAIMAALPERMKRSERAKG